MNRKDDRAVEEALLRRACGYEAEETVEEETERGTKRRVTTHHVPGDVRAQIFWLRNRKPTVWREKPEEDAKRTQKDVIIVDDVP